RGGPVRILGRPIRAAMPVPSLEADLRAAREAAGVSIEQIQHETRIPADVVQRFEAGKLLSDPAFNDVYLKAFLRAYAGAVGLPPNRVVDAYTAYRAGTYRGELNPDAPEPPPPAPEPAAPAEATAPAAEDAAPPPATEAPAPPAERAPAVAALSRAPEPVPPPRPTAAPNEHFPKRRVAPAASVSAPRSFDRSWGTIIGVTAAFVLAVAAILWLLFRDATPEPERTEAPAAADTAAVSDTTAGADTTAATPTQTAGPPLTLPIRVAVLAGGDGLQAFRATEIPDARRPHWVEPGEELVLESNEGVILWGEGAEGMDPDEVTLRWPGFEWRPQEGQILRITPQNGQHLLDSLQAAGARRAAAAPTP